jgi:catalase
MHRSIAALLACGSVLGLVNAACPFADPAALKEKRDDSQQSSDFLDKYKVDDSAGYMTSDVGGPIEEQASLKAGIRGSTLLEDFIFRQKIQHFDHERVGTHSRLWKDMP